MTKHTQARKKQANIPKDLALYNRSKTPLRLSFELHKSFNSIQHHLKVEFKKWGRREEPLAQAFNQAAILANRNDHLHDRMGDACGSLPQATQEQASVHCRNFAGRPNHANANDTRIMRSVTGIVSLVHSTMKLTREGFSGKPRDSSGTNLVVHYFLDIKTL